MVENRVRTHLPLVSGGDDSLGTLADGRGDLCKDRLNSGDGCDGH